MSHLGSKGRNFVKIMSLTIRDHQVFLNCFPIFFFLSPPVFFFFCQFCMDVAVAFPLGNSFIVAIYSHARECSVFESTVICCEFFLSLIMSI